MEAAVGRKTVPSLQPEEALQVDAIVVGVVGDVVVVVVVIVVDK